MPDTTLAPAIDPGGMMDRPGVVSRAQCKGGTGSIEGKNPLSICPAVFGLNYLIGMF